MSELLLSLLPMLIGGAIGGPLGGMGAQALSKIGYLAKLPKLLTWLQAAGRGHTIGNLAGSIAGPMLMNKLRSSPQEQPMPPMQPPHQLLSALDEQDLRQLMNEYEVL